MGGPLSLIFAGDLVLDVEDGDHWLSGIAPALRSADLAIGHLEVPHTMRGTEMKGDVPAPGADPANLAAIARAGFGAVSLAGNHISDCGAVGIADTREGLAALAVAFAGAGKDRAEAETPAFVTCGQRVIALLSFNCVGPELGWAGDHSAGSAALAVHTEDGGPVAPAKTLLDPTAGALARLKTAIEKARNSADIVIVSLHKGLVHIPATLAPYERPLSHAAIDAGADVVLGHHAHIVKGIEVYNGKPIFHGLGNGCVVTRALSPDQDHPARREWAERRKHLFGFEPLPGYDLAPFHPESVNAFLGRVVVQGDGQIEAGLIPVHIEAPGRPVVVNGTRGREIADYVERITVAGGLPEIALKQGDDMMVLQ